MSIPKSHRHQSKLEYFHNAMKLKKEMTLLLLRDFGVKSKSYNVSLLEKSYKMEEDDKESFSNLLEKYGIVSNITLDFPEWYLSKVRDNIYDILNRMINNIIKAESIHPINIAECNEKRLCQDRAISYCFVLLNEFQSLLEILPINATKLRPYIEMINKEITLLRSWRKDTNYIKKQLEEE